MKKIHLWTVGRLESGGLKASPVDEVDNTETENRLEELLVASPDLLLPGLVLVARQLPTDGGPLDLLGIDEEGGLVLFELKRGTLTREAVAQALDYASDLASRERDDLVRLIEDHSGARGIERIEDFADWHAREYPDAPELVGEAPRIVLVGLGVDERARRIVNFLAEVGVDIQLLTFHGFSVDGNLFLARQMETRTPSPKRTGGGASKEENRQQLLALAREHNVEDLLEEVSNFINSRLPCYRWPGKTAYSFSLQERTDEGNPTWRSYVTLYVNQSARGEVLLTFQERAIEAAPNAVAAFLEAVPAASRDDDRSPPVQSSFGPQLWRETVRSELDRLLEGLVVGWKARLNELESQDEEPRLT